MSGGRPGRTVPGGGQALALATLCTLLFLTFLDNTVVSVALGDIQTSLQAGVAVYQDGTWKVGDESLCGLFRLIPGGTVPAACNSAG